MKLVYCHDNIYQQCSDGRIYSPGQFPYKYWSTFLDEFEHVQVVGRGVDLTVDIKKLNISSGKDVSFSLFPNINTPFNRLKYGLATSRRLKNIISEADAVVIRAVSDLGWIAFKHARKMNKPIAMEMAACAWDSTWNHGNKLGKIYAIIRYFRDRHITAKSDYVIYVSQDFLQKRYPTNAQTEIASNVRIQIPDDDIIQKRLEVIKEKTESDSRPQIIGLIGNLNNKIKGVEDAIRALALVEKHKPGSFQFKHLGPGDPSRYQEIAQELKMEHCIHFDGMRQSGQGVLEWLSELDLYIQPSYQEGVPRATIEAMSMACPVIGSTAGGIPELIDKKWLVEPGDVPALSEKIISMLDSTPCQYDAGSQNYLKSLNYTDDKLQPRRQKFWSAFHDFAVSRQKTNWQTILLRSMAITFTMMVSIFLYTLYLNHNKTFAKEYDPAKVSDIEVNAGFYPAGDDVSVLVDKR